MTHSKGIVTMSIAQLPLVNGAPRFWINTNVIVVVITKLIANTITPDGYGGWKTLGEALHRNSLRITAVGLILLLLLLRVSGVNPKELSRLTSMRYGRHCVSARGTLMGRTHESCERKRRQPRFVPVRVSLYHLPLSAGTAVLVRIRRGSGVKASTAESLYWSDPVCYLYKRTIQGESISYYLGSVWSYQMFYAGRWCDQQQSSYNILSHPRRGICIVHGTGVVSMLACYESGADIVDVAMDAMSGVTSQPSLGALMASLPSPNSDFEADKLIRINNYWEQVRLLYKCFDAGTQATTTEVYKHEIPGGQYTNMLFQAQSLGLGSEWGMVKKAYEEANQLLGDIVKVTPSSKVVGDLAQIMVSNKLSGQDVLDQADTLNLPSSVIQYLQGYLGEPHGGFPEPFRTRALRGAPTVSGRPGATLEPMDLQAIKADLTSKYGSWVDDRDVMSYAMYPAVFEEYATHRNTYGDVSKLDSDMVFKPVEIGKEYVYNVDKGRRFYITPVAIGQVDEATAQQDIFFELNGEPKRISVKNTSTASSVTTRPKADPKLKNQVGAPMSAGVLEVRVVPGTKVATGDTLCMLSAMKMEMVVASPVCGTVTSVEVSGGEKVQPVWCGAVECVWALLIEVQPVWRGTVECIM
eukprot:sb/3462936/